MWGLRRVAWHRAGAGRVRSARRAGARADAPAAVSIALVSFLALSGHFRAKFPDAMPELPEVEAQRRLLERHVCGCRIEVVASNEQGNGPRHGLFDDKIIAEGVDEKTLSRALLGKTVGAACRRGKQLWIELCEGGKPCGALLIHLGMTGCLLVRGHTAPTYKNFEPGSEEWPPRFTKLELVLRGPDGEARLAYTDPRRFGRLLLRSADPLTEPPLRLLAADPVIGPPSVEEFAHALSGLRAPIKAVLLDQNRVVCGVGNWIADEVLYQARIVPSVPSDRLSTDQYAALHAALLHVTNLACACEADYRQFPKGWLFHHRWANQTSGSISSPIGRIHFETVGGRTTAYVPAVQQKGAATAAPKTSPKPSPKKKGGASASEKDAGVVPKAKRAEKAKRKAEPAGGAAVPKKRSKRSAVAAPSADEARGSASKQRNTREKKRAVVSDVASAGGRRTRSRRAA